MSKISRKENKTISVNAKTMSVVYTDTNKHFVYHIDSQSPTRDIVLFGKNLRGVKAQDAKEDFLDKHHRRLLNDILYSKGKYTEDQIKKMPLIRQWYILDVSRKAERVIHAWKKEIISKQLDGTLSKLFPKSKLVKQFISMSTGETLGVDVTKINIRNLVTEKEIVEYLQLKGVFPKTT